jgi:hypothetical protein
MGENKPIREIETTIDEIEGLVINIGRVYENKVTKLLVDLSSTLVEHPNATASLVVRQPNWQSYPATVTLNGMTLEWLITDAEIGLQSGTGEIQITVADGEQIYKSAIAQTVILPSILYKSGSIPDPIAHWISQAQAELEKTKEALNTAQNFIADLKQKLDNGELNGKPGPQGEKGEKGDPGKDGSPGATGATPRFTVTAVTGEAGTAASVTQSGTAENPMVEFTIPQGIKGNTGPQGPQGEKGDPGKDAPQETVLYTAQTLDDAQKAQARENIGAADAARQNILVGSETGNPVPIASAGDGGTILVTVGDGADGQQTITLPTPNGLPGIPVTSGGNYTDENGQRWICDEIDLTRGVRVQRNDSFAISSENARNIVIMNDLTKVTVATSARIRTPKQTDKSDELGRNLFCEALPWERDVWASRKNGMGFSENNYIDFAIENSYLGLNEASTNDERKTALVKYFTDNPCQVVYRIATPIETPLTPAELAACKALTTYAPNTVVQASDSAGVKLGYQRDVSIVIKNLEDAIASMTAT